MNEWSPGPWDIEPKEGSTWIDEETNIKCETWRHPKSGHWCGYIYAPTHTLDAFRNECGYEIPGAHYGITYYHEHDTGHMKIGFDCNHAWDTTPTKSYSDSVYRTLSYVQSCIKTMARAVKAEADIRATLGGV